MDVKDPKAALSHQTRAVKELRETLAQMSDFQEDPHAQAGETDTMLADAIEGETNFNEVCVSLLNKALDHEAAAKGVQARIDDLTQRRDRLKRTGETLRAMVMQAMETAGVKQVKDDTLTASTRPVAPKAIIDDESLVPSDYFVVPDPRLDKKALTDALKEGAEIPGARLSNGGASLTVRVK